MPCFAQVVRPHIQPGRRVVAVSDVHGDLPFLKGLLAKVRFCPDDVLIVVGDLLEKGRESLATLRYVMELGKTHTVYTLSGNCDHIDRVLLEGKDSQDVRLSALMRQRYGLPPAGGPDPDVELWPILSGPWRNTSVLAQMGAELGLPFPKGPEELPALRRALREHFPEETGFLLGLPTILEAGGFLFVHGGIPREDRLEELEAYPCMKFDDFLGKGLSFRKWVVVGHWPVTLYDPAVQRTSPILDRERHIACIDGGCVLKVGGQLNTLIIPDIYGEALEYDWYDGLPTVTALDGQEASEHPLNIRWSDSVVEVLKEEGDCVLCRHVSSGRELWAPRTHISRWRDGKTHTEDITDLRLPVSPGDELAVVCQTGRGFLVKKDGITGWYHGRIECEKGT